MEALPGADPLLARLPDDGVLCAHTLWTGIEFAVSYNEAITWACQDQLYYSHKDQWQDRGAGCPSIAVLDERTALAVYDLPDCIGGVAARWLRRVPSDSKEARKRFE